MNKERILINELETFKKINSNVLGIFLVLFGTLLLADLCKSSSSFLASTNDNANFCYLFNWNDLWCKTFFYHCCSLFI